MRQSYSTKVSQVRDKVTMKPFILGHESSGIVATGTKLPTCSVKFGED